MYTPNSKMAAARDDLGRAVRKRGIEGQVTTIRHFGIRCIKTGNISGKLLCQEEEANQT